MDRDYKVVYKAKEVGRSDDDLSRRRIPTALDPYDYPNDRDELKRGVAEAKIRASRKYYNDSHDDFDEPLSRQVARSDYRDDRSLASATEGTATKLTKTTYNVTSDRAGRDAYVTGARSVTTSGPAPSSSASQMREDGQRDITPTRYDPRPPPPPRDYLPAGYNVEVARPQHGVYIVETARGNDIDVYVGHKDIDRGFGGIRDERYIEDAYGRGPSPDVRPKPYYRDGYAYYDQRGDTRSSTRALESSGPYASGAREVDDITIRDTRMQESRRDVPRSAARTVDKEEWRVINEAPDDNANMSFKDPFHDGRAIDGRGRPRSVSQAKPPPEDDYVMVTPPRAARHRERSSENIRSAMFREDRYTPEERLMRRRSRSAHFREGDVPRHSAGEQRHERPGEEARLYGGNLPHYDEYSERDYVDYEYRDTVRQDVRESAYDGQYDGRYPPQMGASRPRRHHHHRHHQDHDNTEDDQSYYSDRKDYRKDTRYY